MVPIRLERLDKVYPNGYPALREVDLDIEAGELMVLVGPSGCGKTTLLRLLAGLETPSAGTIWIGGRRVNDLGPRERNTAMVFQDYALYPTMTVRGNLEFPLKMRRLGAAEIRRRVDWVADLLELHPILQRLPRQISGGQRQRVAMGRAMVREPAVFLLDEPLSNLDAKLRAVVRTEIAELQRRTGTTMIYVTHDQVEAMTLGQRIAVLNQGRVQQVADPGTLYRQPANPFVAGFIGSPPMNLFTVEWLSEGAESLILEVQGTAIARVPVERIPKGALSLIAGIRPEALEVCPAGVDTFPARWIAEEFLGHETLVYARPGLNGGMDTPPWAVRAPGMLRKPPDGVLHLKVRAEDIHLFATPNPRR